MRVSVANQILCVNTEICIPSGLSLRPAGASFRTTRLFIFHRILSPVGETLSCGSKKEVRSSLRAISVPQPRTRPRIVTPPTAAITAEQRRSSRKDREQADHHQIPDIDRFCDFTQISVLLALSISILRGRGNSPLNRSAAMSGDLSSVGSRPKI